MHPNCLMWHLIVAKAGIKMPAPSRSREEGDELVLKPRQSGAHVFHVGRQRRFKAQGFAA